jgi:dimethylamine monooxygenase subunit A
MPDRGQRHRTEDGVVTRLDPASPLALVDGSPWRLAMGLHRLEDGAWLEVDEHRGPELRAKARLLDAASDTVLATLPAGDDASQELLAAVVEHLVAHHDVLDVTGSTLTERTTATTIDVDRLHPIDAASRVTQEDLCVLARDDEAWRLVAACVCFPSRWSLREKLGESLAEIHGPVPGFDRTLADPAATFFDRLAVTRAVWRRNWTLLDTPELHLPSPAARHRDDPHDGELGTRLWFRVERQTLRKLPGTGAIVFTIGTSVRSLDDVVRTTQGFAEALRATLSTVDADVATYKGWSSLLTPLLAWLADAAPSGEEQNDATELQ